MNRSKPVCRFRPVTILVRASVAVAAILTATAGLFRLYRRGYQAGEGAGRTETLRDVEAEVVKRHLL